MRIALLALFSTVAFPSMAQAQVSLSFGGECPAGIDISITGLAPGGKYAVLTAASEGADGTVPGGPCAGQSTGLDAATQRLVTIRNSPASGNVSILDKAVGENLCGKPFAIVDAGACAISPVAYIPDAPPPCTSWEATYDLTGSTLRIDALADFTITLQEPYTNDTNMGPGYMTIRFADNGGAAGPGDASIIDFFMDQNFVTGIDGFASVTTDLENSATDECGVSNGALSSSVTMWSPSTMDPYCQTGTISCEGFFCGTAGSPPENDPIVYNNDCTAQPIDDFTFAADLSSFSMPEVIVDQTPDQTVYAAYQGTLVSMVEQTNTPLCACP